jgi:hypothetical protein
MLPSPLDCESFMLPSEEFIAFSSRVSVFFVSWSFRSVSCSLFLFVSGFYSTFSQLLLIDSCLSELTSSLAILLPLGWIYWL